MSFGTPGKQAPEINLKDVEQVVKLLAGVEAVVSLMKDKKTIEKIRKEFAGKTAAIEAGVKKEADNRSENLRLLKSIQEANEQSATLTAELQAATKASKEALTKLNEEKSVHLQNVKEHNAKVLLKEKELSEREDAALKTEECARKKEEKAQTLLTENTELNKTLTEKLKVLRA